jgi:hypothetical protein
MSKLLKTGKKAKKNLNVASALKGRRYRRTGIMRTASLQFQVSTIAWFRAAGRPINQPAGAVLKAPDSLRKKIPAGFQRRIECWLC